MYPLPRWLGMVIYPVHITVYIFLVYPEEVSGSYIINSFFAGRIMRTRRYSAMTRAWSVVRSAMSRQSRRHRAQVSSPSSTQASAHHLQALCCFEAIIRTFRSHVGQMVAVSQCHRSYSIAHIIDLIFPPVPPVLTVEEPSFFTFTHSIKNTLRSEASYTEIHPLKGCAAGLKYKPVAN